MRSIFFPMKKHFSSLLSGLLVVGASLTTASLQAHEYWFEPLVKPLAAGETAPLDIRVGEYFVGEQMGFGAAQTVALRQYSAAGVKDLRALLPPASRGAVANLNLPLPAPGSYLVAFDSQPSQITLPAGTFHAYLHDEGLDFIKTQREAAGNAEKPGRERYRRHIKTLLKVGGAPSGAQVADAAPDMTFATRTGQRLEIVPMNDPLLMRRGESLGVQVFFDNKPLAGALVKAWNRQTSQTVILRANTGPDGKATFNLPYEGGWMVSVVHMVPTVGAKDLDWDSLWGNLSFNLAPAAGGR